MKPVSKNGHGKRRLTSPLPEGDAVALVPATPKPPEPPALVEGPPEGGKTPSFEKMADELAQKYPRQFHTICTPRSGGSTYTAACGLRLEQLLGGVKLTEWSADLHSVATAAVYDPGAIPSDPTRLEYYGVCTSPSDYALVCRPGIDQAAKSAALTAYYRLHRSFKIQPVFWMPRLSPLVFRNTFLGLLPEIQRRSPEPVPASQILRAAFRIASNDTRPDAIEQYGIDDLAELLNDPALGRCRLAVSRRLVREARLRVDGFGVKGVRLEDGLIALSDKVARLESLNGGETVRQVVKQFPASRLVFAGWDLVQQSEAHVRQADLPQQFFMHMASEGVAETSRNSFPIGSIIGSVRTDPTKHGKTLVTHLDTDAVAPVVAEHLAELVESVEGPVELPSAPAEVLDVPSERPSISVEMKVDSVEAKTVPTEESVLVPIPEPTDSALDRIARVVASPVLSAVAVIALLCGIYGAAWFGLLVLFVVGGIAQNWLTGGDRRPNRRVAFGSLVVTIVSAVIALLVS